MEEKELKEKNNKKNLYLIITIVVFTFLIVTLATIFIIKAMPKEETEKVKEPEIVEETEEQEDVIVNIEEKDITQILEQINDYNMYLGELFPVEDTALIENKEILIFANNKIPYNAYSSDGTFMQTDLEKQVAIYFGNTYEINHQDIPCEAIRNEILYKYDSAKRIYTYYGMHGHGGAAYNKGYVHFIDGTYNETQKTYTINTKIIYRNPIHDTSGPATSYYKNATDAMNNTNQIYIVSDEEFMTLKPETVYEKTKDNLPITTYEFKVDSDGNYGLTKVSIK